MARMGNPQLIMQIHDELIYEVAVQSFDDNNSNSDGSRYVCMCVHICICMRACSCVECLCLSMCVCVFMCVCMSA